MSEKKPQKKTWYRTDPITGEEAERIVVTPADEVRAQYDGFAEKRSGKKSSTTSGSTSSSTRSPAGDSDGEADGGPAAA